MCMVYNGSDHFDFLRVNRVIVNQDHMVLCKYGVVKDVLKMHCESKLTQ